jgi:hypothetical protein
MDSFSSGLLCWFLIVTIGVLVVEVNSRNRNVCNTSVRLDNDWRWCDLVLMRLGGDEA